jgi:1-acyl-sn-glycerol-3-phosphate acyltransferase
MTDWKDLVPELPPRAPRTSNPAGRLLGRTILWLGGWRFVGDFPDVDKLVIIAAPHSSGMDAVWGLAAKIAMGLRITIMAKKELFWFPLGPFLRLFGAIPVDREAALGVVGAVTERFEQQQKMWYVLAPEGTRKHVTKWKSGFWHIARGAGVPVQCAYFHYPEKVIGLGRVFEMTSDLNADMARVREFYRPWVGKHRGT